MAEDKCNPKTLDRGTASGVDNESSPNFGRNFLITYDCKSGKFDYSSAVDEVNEDVINAPALWDILVERELASKETAELLRSKIMEIAAADKPQVYFTKYYIKNVYQEKKWYRFGFVCAEPGGRIDIAITDITDEIANKKQLRQMADYDELTGLLKRDAFTARVEKRLRKDENGIAEGKYAMIFFDIVRFKAVNDIFGALSGDRLLRYIADVIKRFTDRKDAACRIGSDRFVIFTNNSGSELERLIENIFEAVAEFDLPFEITCNAGIYVTDENALTVDYMVNCAILAQSKIKGSYTHRYNYYTEDMRKDMLSEQEIVGMMSTALAQKQFVVYYQPQYNHSTGMLLGSEALVRWKHPEKGIISPGLFIPIFEKNGFVTQLDLYVFEEVCAFLRRCMDKGAALVPISTNFSRHDIFQPHFVDWLEEIRKKYDVPAKYLRVEITETTVIGGSQHTEEVVKALHECGYIVEMDDFGSGYSSLNVLKDIDFDIIKLDMLFLADNMENNRGGTILSSVIRMAKWLKMPVIAEGVETVDQADFLRSIGCDYIQGYLYSRPIPEEEYDRLVSGSQIGAVVPQLSLIEALDSADFWEPKSQETLIFNNFVGGAAIFDYRDGKVEVLRVNKKYLQEICMNLSEKDIVDNDPFKYFDEKNKAIYIDMLERAIKTGEEQECETWRTISSSCCGEELFCIRSAVRMIGKSDDSYLFYAMIRNITAEKREYADILDSERRFKMASEQVNIYYWEYTIATREMRPCFRCMRDLGLPPLLTNYPDSAIEMGIFPPEVADMYRDWHRQLAEGVPSLEAVIPLTADRVPFHVRYTTEFDENGHPVKAYGSAALVVDK